MRTARLARFQSSLIFSNRLKLGNLFQTKMSDKPFDMDNQVASESRLIYRPISIMPAIRGIRDVERVCISCFMKICDRSHAQGNMSSADAHRL